MAMGTSWNILTSARSKFITMCIDYPKDSSTLTPSKAMGTS